MKLNARTDFFGAFLLVAGLASTVSTAFAAEATTFTSSFSVPVFDQIDPNGVDLVSGTWRVQSPVIWIGDGPFKQVRGLQWTGQAWTHIGQPSLWYKDGKYTVMYKGASHEFNGFGSGFTKREPIDGSSLSCDTLTGDNGITYCRFTSRDGDFVVFQGVYSAISNYGQYYGLSALEFGNVGIQDVIVSEVAFGSPLILRNPNGQYYRFPTPGLAREFGFHDIQYGAPAADINYKNQLYYINLETQRIIVNTPNNDASDEHYLLPKNTIQTFTDGSGYQWSFQFNNSRDLIGITSPGGAAPVTATYYSNHRVATITTAAGTWNYAYTLTGTFRTTTVTNPQGEVTFVKYHYDDGYVTEARDALNRTTYYNWNATTRRLDRATFPEGNYVAFEYDGRGNVTRKTEVSKNGATSLVSQAVYAPSCSSANQANCNQPLYIIDPRGNRTDFEYTGNSPGPTRILLPAATPGAPRPTTTNVYSGGLLARSSACMTQSTCAGASDEIVTEYGYTARFFENSWRFDGYVAGAFFSLVQVKVTSNGQSLVTCHQYDTKGHLVGSTPPSANMSSCPTNLVAAVPETSNPPSNTATRSLPTFPGVTVP